VRKEKEGKGKRTHGKGRYGGGEMYPHTEKGKDQGKAGDRSKRVTIRSNGKKEPRAKIPLN